MVTERDALCLGILVILAIAVIGRDTGLGSQASKRGDRKRRLCAVIGRDTVGGEPTWT